jgi:hypothetical protein
VRVDAVEATPILPGQEAAILGLLLGLGVAFLLERFDRRIREPKDLEAVYGLPLLGVVPKSAALARSGRRKDGSGEVADVLIGAVAMNEAVQAVAMDLPQSEAAGGRTLGVLVAGATLPPNPGEPIETDRRSASAMEVPLSASNGWLGFQWRHVSSSGGQRARLQALSGELRLTRVALALIRSGAR